MSFPKLIPAFTARIAIQSPAHVGTVKAAALAHVPFITGTAGSFKSEDSYPIHFDGHFEHGADYITVDPDGKHARLDVSSVAKDAKNGALLRYDYQGTIDLAGPAGKVLEGAADAKTTEFGDAFTQIQLYSGDEKLKALESKIFVGSGRFVLEAGKPVIVEYKISEVAA